MTINDVTAQAKLYFTDENKLIYRSTPTLTYHQLFVLLLAVIVLGGIAIALHLVKQRRRQ